MQIINETWAAIWRKGKGTQAFHADIPKAFAPTAFDAAAFFNSLYPADTLIGIKGPDGRFQAFRRAIKRLVIPFTTASPMRKRAIIRTALKQGTGKFATVHFVKNDGSTRIMRVLLKGDSALTKDASPERVEAAKKAALAHPEHFPIWDREAKAIRKINLDKVTRVEANGKTYTF